jgi:hypothetical protein
MRRWAFAFLAYTCVAREADGLKRVSNFLTARPPPAPSLTQRMWRERSYDEGDESFRERSSESDPTPDTLPQLEMPPDPPRTVVVTDMGETLISEKVKHNHVVCRHRRGVQRICGLAFAQMLASNHDRERFHERPGSYLPSSCRRLLSSCRQLLSSCTDFSPG